MKFALAVAMRPPEHYLPMALAAEESGWDTIVVPDSVFYPEKVSAPYPYTADGARFWPADTPYLDPFVAMAHGDEAKAVAFRFMDALQVFDLANNLGDAKSIATHPATTTHRRLGPEGRAAVGMCSATIRLSIGLEDVEDLRADLERALEAV